MLLQTSQASGFHLIEVYMYFLSHYAKISLYAKRDIARNHRHAALSVLSCINDHMVPVTLSTKMPPLTSTEMLHQSMPRSRSHSLEEARTPDQFLWEHALVSETPLPFSSPFEGLFTHPPLEIIKHFSFWINQL